MKKRLIVNTHNSAPLNKIVMRLAKESGFTHHLDTVGEDHDCEEIYIILPENNHSNQIGWTDNVGWLRDNYPGAIWLDAATEFGKLIELLEEKEKRIEQITTDCSGNWIHGTVAKDEAGLNYLQLSHGKCVHGDKIKEIYTAMFEEEK